MVLLASMASLTANNVNIVFNHHANGDAVSLNSSTHADWQGNTFTITRGQFYISQLTLIHDGGQEMDLSDTYLLVNINNSNYPIGDLNINELEGIRFSIGVDEDVNHDDPAAWPTDHPLALQSPSMHWGWSPGYRFVALEGYIGADEPSTNYQYHCVGDQFLTPIDLATDGIVNGQDLNIHINVDWARFFDNYNAVVANYMHGAGEPIPSLMDNLDAAFDAPTSIGTAVTTTIQNNYSATNYPNPFSEKTTINYDLGNAQNISLMVSDLTGRTVASYQNLANNGSVELQKSLSNGIYFYTFYSNNEAVIRNKMQVVR